MSFSIIFVHFVDQSFLVVRRTISESSYRVKVLKECHPKWLKQLEFMPLEKTAV